MISARARAQVLFEKFGCENFRFLYVFVKFDFEIIARLVVLEGLRHARAAERA